MELNDSRLMIESAEEAKFVARQAVWTELELDEADELADLHAHALAAEEISEPIPLSEPTSDKVLGVLLAINSGELPVDEEIQRLAAAYLLELNLT